MADNGQQKTKHKPVGVKMDADGRSALIDVGGAGISKEKAVQALRGLDWVTSATAQPKSSTIRILWTDPRTVGSIRVSVGRRLAGLRQKNPKAKTSPAPATTQDEPGTPVPTDQPEPPKEVPVPAGVITFEEVARVPGRFWVEETDEGLQVLLSRRLNDEERMVMEQMFRDYRVLNGVTGVGSLERGVRITFKLNSAPGTRGGFIQTIVTVLAEQLRWRPQGKATVDRLYPADEVPTESRLRNPAASQVNGDDALIALLRAVTERGGSFNIECNVPSARLAPMQ